MDWERIKVMKATEVLPYDFTYLKNKISETKLPDNLKKFKLDSLESLFQSEYPNSNMEEWRKLSLKNLSLKDLLQKEIILDSQFTKSQDSLKQLNSILEVYKNNFFALLHFSLSSNFNFISLDSNSKLTHQFVPQNKTFFCTNIYSVSKNTSAQFIENFTITQSEDIRLFLPFTIIFLEPNSKLDFTTLDEYSNSDIHVRYLHTVQEANTSLNLNSFFLKGYKGKTFINSFLNGSNSNLNINGATSLFQREIHDIETKITHNASHTDSSILYRTVVADKSHHIFTGNLHIPSSSRKVNASQVNHNLSLSKTARAESTPKLEVFADDVKCSHGATVSEVNADQLFYLQSRGMPEKEARFLIIEGFLKEILDKIQEENLRDTILKNFLNKIGA